MTNIYQNNGKYTVAINGIVIGHNLTRAEALKRVKDYDFE